MDHLPPFTPLFRLPGGFDASTDQNEDGGSRRTKSSFPDFQPRIDVFEVDDAYELHARLPGLSKEDV